MWRRTINVTTKSLRLADPDHCLWSTGNKIRYLGPKPTWSIMSQCCVKEQHTKLHHLIHLYHINNAMRKSGLTAIIISFNNFLIFDERVMFYSPKGQCISENIKEKTFLFLFLIFITNGEEHIHCSYVYWYIFSIFCKLHWSFLMR